MNWRVAVATSALLCMAAADGEPRYRSSTARRIVAERDWGPVLGPYRQRLVPSMMKDFGERYIYRAANAALLPPQLGERRVIFIGDSITDGWNLAGSFPGQPYINRGIGGQVTAQMLVRFQQDVVALQPKAVVILGGVNDVQGLLQEETPDGIVANVEAMADIARAHEIAVVLASILPVNDYTPAARNVVRERQPATLAAINVRLRDLARRRGYGFADYAAVLRDERGLMEAAYTRDGIHPTAAGYARMGPVVAAAIGRVLKR